jgi:hypothetical protein
VLASLIPSGCNFGQDFKDSRDKRNFSPPFLLSRLCSRSGGAISIATTNGNPQHHSGSPTDHQSGLSNYDPEGHWNKLSDSGSHSLEWRSTHHDCG